MNTRLAVFTKAIPKVLIFVGVFAFLDFANAQISSRSKRVIVEQPTNLPELARTPGIAFHLNTDCGDGSAYLYVEQANGRRLVVFDVTDPAHIRMLRTVNLSTEGPFDFVRELDDSTVLIQYRNARGEALLDLHKAKRPVLRLLNGAEYSGHIESLDSSTYLAMDSRESGSSKAPRDYRVIDASNPANPSVLYTARLVTASTVREETGTTFLLGASGLTIIRHPQMEEEYEAEQRTN